MTFTSWATLKGHDDGVVRWDWQYLMGLLILVLLLAFIAVVSALVW